MPHVEPLTLKQTCILRALDQSALKLAA